MTPSPSRDYGVALGATGVALAVDLLVQRLGAEALFTPLLVAILISAWWGGRGPGLASAALATLAMIAFTLAGEGLAALATPSGASSLGVFTACAGLTAVIAGQMQAARRRAEEREREIEHRGEAARRAMAALAQSEARFRELLELAPDGIIIVDRGGRIVLANTQAHRMFDYGPAGLPGRSIDTLVPDRWRPAHADHRERYHAQPRTRPMGGGLDLLGRRQDGSELAVEISLSPVQTAEGILVMAVVRDITDRKQTAEQIRTLDRDLEGRLVELAALNRELESFSYSVSHDLRAPLRAIDGFSQALLEEYGERLDADGRDYLGRVRAAAQRMGELIDDLLDLSRVSRREMQREPVDLSAIARAVVQHLRRAEPDRAVEVAIAEGLAGEGDPQLLRIALENLIGNAWKFTGRRVPARIEVGAACVNGGKAFFVADNGVGFDMAHAGKLFGAFQRLHGVNEFPGTGIGLATVQRIVLRHGGRVWAEAVADQGATFFFTLSGGGSGSDGRQDDPARGRQS